MKWHTLLRICAGLFVGASPSWAADNAGSPPDKASAQEKESDVAALKSGFDRASRTITFEGKLPGELGVELASARPAVKADYLIYAAALDQYATEKEAILRQEPVLRRFVHQPLRHAWHCAINYKTVYHRYAPSRGPKEEAQRLEHFLAHGYDQKTSYRGELRKQIEDYVKQLQLGVAEAKEPQKERAPDAPEPEGPSLADLEDGLLPGQSGVENFSRPQSRLDYLLYAAFLDHYAGEKAELLKSEPVLKAMVHDKLRYLAWALESPLSNEHRDSEDEQSAKAKLFRELLAKGYDGTFQPEVESFIAKVPAS